MEEENEESCTARPYQEQLLQCALKENVVIYLPTGAGKTFIALMALEEMSKDLQGTLAEGGKRSVFLCNTIALAKQQYNVIKSFTKLKARCYTGDMNVDNWKRDRWEVEFDKYQVFISTCQIILDCVRHNFITINDFNVIIFDECHNASGGHPMHQLMKSFMYAKQKPLPRVIGLTGILVTSSVKASIFKNLNDLEAVFRAKIVTVENFDDFKNVLIYSTKPKESMLRYSDIKIKLNICTRIGVIIEESITKINLWKVDETHLKLSKNLGSVRCPSPIKKLENLLKDFLYQMNEMGIYAASIAIMAVLVEVELKKRAAETSVYRNMLRYVIGVVERIRHIIVQSIYDPDDENEKEHEVIMENATPKLQKFLHYLEKTFARRESSDIKCLVFVQRRHTAKVLYHIIKAFVKSNTSVPIKPEFMVGNAEAMPESIDSILDIKYSRKVLDNFERNECNLIVASSVLEEGIDIQSCNYVIVFDKILGFRQYIQTKGRARMAESDYVVMIPESEDQKLIKNIQDYKEIDLLLKQYLIGKTIDRKVPLIQETNKQFEVIIEPFLSKTGARLEAESAVPLLNRYCTSLPSDTFTKSSLIWSLITRAPSVILKLKLPIQSTIKDEILSDSMMTVKMAKKSAAFKACKLLYQNGELDNHLLPITNKKRVKMIQPKYFQHWSAFPMDNPRTAGTRKHRRKHDIQFPIETYSAAPNSGQKCYMYSICLEPLFNYDIDESNKVIFNSLKNSDSFAILSTNQIPELAAMPMFMSQGEVLVKISPNPNILLLDSEEQIKKLRNFHVMIFKDLLKYSWTEYLAINYQNKENSFMIVPISNEGEVNWNVVNNFQNLPEVYPTNDLQRRRMTFKKEDYLNKVISTWYTTDNTIRYIVKAIRDDLNPLTPFPSQSHESFAHYIEDKYQVKIQNNTQFLIEVQPISSRKNFLIFNQGNRKKSKKFDSIILIPEACYNFKFPCTFWLKARFLPSILHRVHYTLIAENIRNRLNEYLNIVASTYKPEPLIVDKSLPRVVTGQIEESSAPKLPSIVKNTVCTNSNDQSEILIRHKYKWAPYMEPVNVDRNLTDLYKIDVEYVTYFKELYQKLNDLNIHEEESQFEPHKIGTTEIRTNNALAICDVRDRREIKILNIKEPQTPEQWEILAAITTAGANDVFDMERLEVLGDSFLKFSISLYLLKQHPTWNEGHLTTVKGQFVSNRNLFYISVNNKLPGALKSREFKGDEWIPPLISVPQNAKNLVTDVSESVFTTILLNDQEILKGECEQNTLNNLKREFVHHQIPDNESDMCYLLNQYWISDKVCADSIEALLGVCVQKYGIIKSFSILQFFGICPRDEPNLEILLKLDLGNPRLKTNIPDREVDYFLLNYQELEKNLSYKFKDRAYLLQALTHPSYPTNHITGCYQQLEFIGDAILDFLITSYIFERCKDMDPGKLTDLRSALVNNVTLACISVRNKFHLFMLSQNATLTQSVMRFYEFQKQQDFRVTDQVRILLLEDETNNTMADYIGVPKALGDIFEALIGAIFLDSNNDLKTTWNVIYNLMQNEINEFIINVPIQVVRQLQEYHGADCCFSSPIVNDDVVMINCRFTCRDVLREVSGFGQNKDQAKLSAAKAALQILFKT